MSITSNDFGFLGLGQGGGNIVEIAESFEYRTGIINTADEDLKSVELVRNKLKLGSEGGCAKDRTLGIEIVKKHYKEAIDFVKTTFENQKVIFVVFTTGGGTGSSFGPVLTDILRKTVKDKLFINVAIMPTDQESIASIDNTIECLREIYNLKVPTYLVDNEKFMAKNKGKSRKDLFDIINTYIISNFNLLFKSKLKESSKYGNIDSKELFKLLEPSGMSIISRAKFDEQELRAKGIEQIILSSIDSHIYAKINNDKVVARMGFIYEVPTRLMSVTGYEKIKEELGEPLEIFDGFRELSDDAKEFRVITILSGLSFPKERIEDYALIADDKYDKIKVEDNEDIFEGLGKKRNALADKRSSINKVKEEKTTEAVSADELDLSNLFASYE